MVELCHTYSHCVEVCRLGWLVAGVVLWDTKRFPRLLLPRVVMCEATSYTYLLFILHLGAVEVFPFPVHGYLPSAMVFISEIPLTKSIV